MSSCQSLRDAAHSSADQSSRRPWGTLLLAHSHSLSAIAPATSAGTSAWRPTTCHFGWSHSQSQVAGVLGCLTGTLRRNETDVPPREKAWRACSSTVRPSAPGEPYV